MVSALWMTAAAYRHVVPPAADVRSTTTRSAVTLWGWSRHSEIHCYWPTISRWTQGSCHGRGTWLLVLI